MKVLCADVGGTNLNLSIMDVSSKKPVIVKIENYPTKNTTDFAETINHFIENSGYELKEACFSIAGPINNEKDRQYASMTNADILIDTKELKEKTTLDRVLLINDFEAISYATNILDEKDLYVLNKGKPVGQTTRAVMGPGTGLGASILYYNKDLDNHIPIPSEGGHTDFIPYNEQEIALAEFVKKEKNREPLENEDLVSGPGLEIIYRFLNKDNKYPPGLNAMQISEQKNENQCAKETYHLFVRLLARCCKNFALQTLCRGGLFIGGGIAAKNYEVFDNFMEEFSKHSREPFAEILRNTPVWVITNYDISHLGAAYALVVDRYSYEN